MHLGYETIKHSHELQLTGEATAKVFPGEKSRIYARLLESTERKLWDH